MKMVSKVSPKAGKWGFQSIFGRGSTPNFGKKSCQIVPRQIHEIFSVEVWRFKTNLPIRNSDLDFKTKPELEALELKLGYKKFFCTHHNQFTWS